MKEREYSEAAILLESRFKNEMEAQEQKRIDDERFKPDDNGGILDFWVDAIAKTIERRMEEIRREAREVEAAAMRQEMIEKLKTEAEKHLLEAKTIGDLERRAADVERTLQNLDNKLKTLKGDITKDRLEVDKSLKIIREIKETAKKIPEKNTEIKFTDRQTLTEELNRCYQQSQSLNVDKTNAKLRDIMKETNIEIKKMVEETNKNIKELYEKSKDVVFHEKPDKDLYYYQSNNFNGSGIPKDSPTGKAIEAEVLKKMDYNKAILETDRAQRTLSKLPPEQQQNFSIRKDEKFYQAINRKLEEQQREREKSYEQER